jgi:hypothetical protein
MTVNWLATVKVTAQGSKQRHKRNSYQNQEIEVTGTGKIRGASTTFCVRKI